MSSSSSLLQNSISLLFFLVIYIPCNVLFMVIAAALFSTLNKLLNLHFPIWVLAIAAALLVFFMMTTFLTSSSDDTAIYYFTTAIINLLVVILMLTLTGISKLIFSSHSSVPFSFEKPQLITVIIYVVITGIFAIQPLISDANGYISDVKNEKYLTKIKEIIETDNLEDFTVAFEKNYKLQEIKLPGEERDLLEYLVAHDKVAMLHVLLKDHKDTFTYTYDWDIKSPAMMQQLIDDGMNPNQLLDELTAYDRTDMVKIAVGKYHPTFTSSVSYITKNVIEHKNTKLLDYLIEKGLAKDVKQSNNAIYWFAEKKDFDSVYLLIEKGFLPDTSDNALIYQAIYSHNLPFLKFLFTYPFDVNKSNDEYTNLENAIAGNDEDIVDFLLTKNPDVQTLHYTKLNGETNALLMAERYKRPEILEKLKHYVARNKQINN